jgi:hypothetical protein
LPALPNTLGRMSCSHCLSTVMTPAPTSAPHLPGAADHRHEGIRCRCAGRRRGVDEALQVGIQPARGAGVQRGDHEDHHARAEVSTPIASAITMPPLRRADRPPRGSRAGCGW